MALQNDPRMFTGGAVVFNSNPTVQFQAQQLAKKQAKEEALNKYFDDQLKSLNTEGIRKHDLVDPEGKGRGIVDKINAWQKKWMENKEGILRGGQPKMQSDMELQDIRRQIAEAKAAGSFFNDLGKARAKGEYNPDEDELHLLDKVAKPIYDPESKKADGTPYGWGDVAPVVPEFDAKKQNEYWLASTKGLQPGKQYDYDKLTVNAKTGQAIVPFKEAYSPGQVKAIAEQAGEIAMNDKSVKKHFNKILDSPTSEEWEKLNKAYQSVFGTDKVVSTPEQAAQADAIIRASVPTKEGQEQEVNYAQRLYDKKMMAAFNSALIASRGGGVDETKIRDVYKSIRDKVLITTNKVLPLNQLSTDEQSIALKQARDLTSDNELSQADIYLMQGADGGLHIMKANEQRVMRPGADEDLGIMNFEGTNIPVQPSIKEKREVIQSGKTNKTQKATQSDWKSRAKVIKSNG